MRYSARSQLGWFAIVLLVGCSQSLSPAGKDGDSTTPEPRPSVALRVLVVNEPELAESILRLRGEWEAHGGGSLSTESKPWSEIAAAESTDADVVVFPVRYLGELCVRDLLRPVRDRVLRGKDYNAEGVFPLVRQRLGAFGGRSMALPLSVQVPMFGYRLAWLQAVGNEPPNSWADYHNLLTRINDAPSTFPDRDAITNWPAIMLLARAAAYACHPQQESVLFDPQSMEPRIAEAPFVRALDQWRRDIVLVTKTMEASNDRENAPGEPSARLVWAELPGAEQAFNHATGEWETFPSEPRRVPLLSDGWLIAVTTGSRNAATAFELIGWLASAEISSQLAPAFKATLPCRRAQSSATLRGFEASSIWTVDTGIAKPLEAALGRSDAFMVPRIPGVDEYLAALSDSVEKALHAERTPADALHHAATEWNQITDRHGRDAQRRAYHNHLGITEP